MHLNRSGPSGSLHFAGSLPVIAVHGTNDNYTIAYQPQMETMRLLKRVLRDADLILLLGIVNRRNSIVRVVFDSPT